MSIAETRKLNLRKSGIKKGDKIRIFLIINQSFKNNGVQIARQVKLKNVGFSNTFLELWFFPPGNVGFC